LTAKLIGLVVAVVTLLVAHVEASEDERDCREFSKLSGLEIGFRLSDGGSGRVPEGGEPDDYLASDPGHGLRPFFLRRDGGWATTWSPDGRSHHFAPVVKVGDGGWVYQTPLSDGGWLEKQQLPDGGWLCIPGSKPP
jgi:hypothetical protein